jgi:hypothetical protein
MANRKHPSLPAQDVPAVSEASENGGEAAKFGSIEAAADSAEMKRLRASK